MKKTAQAIAIAAAALFLVPAQAVRAEDECDEVMDQQDDDMLIAANRYQQTIEEITKKKPETDAEKTAFRNRFCALTGEMLELVGLQNRAEIRAADLAYGEQRRLELLRALATRPRLLMLDEPAAGMNASVTLLVSVVENQLLVPNGAVRRQGNQSFVYQPATTPGGQPIQKPVVTAGTDGTNTAIASGLAEGDTVLLGAIGTATPTASRTGATGTNNQQQPGGGIGGGPGGGIR